MAANPHPRVGEEEYFRLDDAADFKSEYWDGDMLAMSGGSPAHALIITNLAAELRRGLKPTNCSVYVTELRLKLAAAKAYVYPDVVVVCGELKLASDQRNTVLNPAILVEVLSPSTEITDRSYKLAQYRKLESLQEYALVSQSEPKLELYRRQSPDQWLFFEWTGLEAVCRFASLGCEVPLAEIYHRVRFEEAETAEP